MTALVITLACAAVVAAAVAVLALLALRRVRREARREAAELRDRLDLVESRLRQPVAEPVVRTEHEYVITHLGELAPGPEGADGQDATPVRLTPPAFADAVLRETVVQTAALVQGVRRALAAETRHRIRFEMRREVKRARKDRKVEVKEALREYRARNRAAQTVPAGRDSEGAA